MRAVAILPVGAVEAHGPHLPLTTDVIISEAMARSAAEKLDTQGYYVLILPSISYTAAPFAASFPGTCSLDPVAVIAVLMSIARNLTRQGGADGDGDVVGAVGKGHGAGGEDH